MSAIHNLITDNIDIWTGAIKKKATTGRGSNAKVELTGVKKLRELILELAVRGKLVPQDPNDEPAAVLLEKIAEEKARLVKEKKIKKPKALPAITEDEKPFDLPAGWEWCRLNDLSSYIQRGKSPKYAEFGKVRVISQKCVQNSGFTLNPARFIADDTISKYQSERFLLKNDLLWNSTGTGTVGRANVLDTIELNSLVADSHVTVVRPILVFSHFLWCFIMAPTVQARIQPDHEKALVSGSTKQVELNTTSVQNLIVPICPFNEQERIVKKVNELMLLCDQLEQQTAQSIIAHRNLVEVLLNTLIQSANADEFQQNWQRIATHFDTLFTTEHSIEQLKQTILQLAVMGKLVPQDFNDEPATILLKKIAAEKESLIKQKKIKRQKVLATVEEHENAITIPLNWAATRLFNILTVTSELTPSLDHPEAKQIAPDLIEKNTGRIISHRSVREAGITGPNNKFKKGQLLYSKIRPSLNKIVIAPYDGLCSADMYPMNSYIDVKFNQYLMLSELFLVQVRLVENRVKMPKINLDSLGKLVVYIPPLAEQKRIVAKVDQLMDLCNQLQSKIQQNQATKVTLAEALVKQGLN